MSCLLKKRCSRRVVVKEGVVADELSVEEAIKVQWSDVAHAGLETMPVMMR